MCVHTRHCCRVHGCKYGEVDCPVWLVQRSQECPCEVCWEYDIKSIESVPKIKIKEIIKRRSECSLLECWDD